MSTKIQVARTDEPQLRPNAIQLAPGQPVFNYNETEPGLYFKLRNNELCKIGPVHVGPQPPNNAALGWPDLSIGETWLDTGSGSPELKIWSGSDWMLSTTASRQNQTLTAGEGLIGVPFDGTLDQTWEVDSSSSNIGGKLVVRDSQGDFSAGVITATLNGQSTGSYSAIKAGSGLTGGGQLTRDRTLAVAVADNTINVTDSGISLNTTNYAIWENTPNFAVINSKARTAPTTPEDPTDVLTTKGYVDTAIATAGSSSTSSDLSGATLTLSGDAVIGGQIQGENIRTLDSGGQITANYNLVTENTSPSLGLFIGCPNSLQPSVTNSGASITGDGSATFASNLTKLTAAGSLFLETTSSQEGLYVGKKGSGDWNAVIDGSNGSATFAGDITKSAPSGSSSCIIGDTFLRIYDSPVSLTDYKISLDNDGSGTFAGQVTAGVATGAANTSGVGVGSDGYVTIVQNTRSSQSCLQVYDSANSVETFSVLGNGSANFGANADWAGGYFNIRKGTNNWAQTVSIDSTSTAPSGVMISAGVDAPAGGTAFLIQKGQPQLGGSSATNILNVDWNGNSTFGGTIVAGEAPAASGTPTGVEIRTNGLIQTARSSGSPIFNAYTTGGSGPTITFTSNGNATFSGNIVANDYIQVGANVNGIANLSLSGTAITTTIAGVGPAALTINTNTTIDHSGNAQFNGTVTAANFNINNLPALQP